MVLGGRRMSVSTPPRWDTFSIGSTTYTTRLSSHGLDRMARLIVSSALRREESRFRGQKVCAALPGDPPQSSYGSTAHTTGATSAAGRPSSGTTQTIPLFGALSLKALLRTLFVVALCAASATLSFVLPAEIRGNHVRRGIVRRAVRRLAYGVARVDGYIHTARRHSRCGQHGRPRFHPGRHCGIRARFPVLGRAGLWVRTLQRALGSLIDHQLALTRQRWDSILLSELPPIFGDDDDAPLHTPREDADLRVDAHRPQVRGDRSGALGQPSPAGRRPVQWVLSLGLPATSHGAGQLPHLPADFTQLRADQPAPPARRPAPGYLRRAGDRPLPPRAGEDTQQEAGYPPPPFNEGVPLTWRPPVPFEASSSRRTPATR